MNKIIIISFIALALLFVISSNVNAESNESIQARVSIESAKQSINSMSERNISTSRVNETLQQASQLYFAQSQLEASGKKADYSLVLNYSNQINDVKESAFKAQDELSVFLTTYNSAKQNTNLSDMQDEYNAVIKSFNEERFEDTIPLIDKAYQKLSEVQASQTSARLFYDTTSRTLKKFLVDNWIILSSGAILIVILIILFWNQISRYNTRRKINNLIVQKDALYSLIKKLQIQYFKQKNISETEYATKLEAFKEMIRDIDRQIPLLREKLAKIDKKQGKKISAKM